MNQNSLRPLKPGRREFVKAGLAGFSGLILGIQMGCTPSDPLPPASFSPNVYLNINEKGDVTIVAHRTEFGQGVRTSLPQILADELEADWDRVRIVQAEGDEAKYGNQNTDGSFSIRMFYAPMRRAGAAARTMLERAAAQQWEVDAAECRALRHQVIHEPSGKSASFGELAGIASTLEIPNEEEVRLKDKKDFRYIGQSLPFVDLRDIVTGQAEFGLDAKKQGMKIAVIQRCPVHGGKVKSYNREEIAAMPGIHKTYMMESPGFPPQLHNPLGGVVIVANDTWSAIKAKKALKVEWEFGPNANYNTKSFSERMEKRTQTSGTIHRESGNVKQTLRGAAQTIDSTYRLPHYAHTSMEPPCALAHFDKNANFCEVWAPSQHPQWARGSIAGALEIEEKDVQVNVTLVGGGFGRKSKPDFVVEAALISKECDCPIQVLWTREDDIQHDFYHAISIQRVIAALDKEKRLVGWNHRSAFPSIGGTSSPEAIEPSTGELGLGLLGLPYDIPNICLETNRAEAQVRIGWLRSVANIQHAFSICSMMDEIAHARQLDPVENLLDLLGENRLIEFDKILDEYPNYGEKVENYPWNTARLKKAIELVAEKSNWGKDLPAGRGQGIAAHRSFLTYVACVVEVEINDRGNISIPEVHYAVDCGLVVNPDTVRNQFEGGAVFAASLALKSKITLSEGRVEQSNFHDYFLSRMPDAPKKIAVHLVESEEKPTGVGEPPVPPFIPALCNAIYAATGKRVRDLPVQLS